MTHPLAPMDEELCRQNLVKIYYGEFFPNLSKGVRNTDNMAGKSPQKTSSKKGTNF
jgi:hypothetical protein